MDKATGANRGDQRRGGAPSRADHGVGAGMVSESSRSQREHNRRPDGSAKLVAALRKFDARSEAAPSKIRLFGRHCRDAGAFGRAAEMNLDDQLLVRLPAPPEGRRAPLQVVDATTRG
jgi:hypothetical protein